MKRIIFLMFSYTLLAIPLFSQVSITTLGEAVTQNFNSIGNTATASLPSGWKVNTTSNHGTGLSATTVAAGTSGTGTISTTGGCYNFADGVTASSTDRAVGFLSSGSYSSPRYLIVQVQNTTGSTITNFTISFNYEKYRSGSRAFNMTFFGSPDGTTWTSYTSGDQAYSADANSTTVSNPPGSIAKTVSISGLSIANGGNYYFYWCYTGVGGSTNGQAIGIDDFSITGSMAATPVISVVSALSSFSQTSTSPSAEQSYTVSGINLETDVTVTAPTGFEVSKTSGSGFASSVTLTMNSGSLVGQPVTVYARMNTASNGAPSGNITHTSTNAATVNVAVSGLHTVNYYLKSSGNVDDVASWGTETDGSSTNPTNFTDAGQIFNLHNQGSPAIGTSWTVSGTGSKIVVGDGSSPCSFTINAASSIPAADVAAQSILTIQSTAIPTFGTLSSMSLIVYDGDGTHNQAITQTTYGNLKLSSAGTKTFAGNTTTVAGNLILDNTTLNGPGSSPFATISLGGDLTYSGTVTPPADGSSITLATTGTGTQTITGNGNTSRWFRVQTANSGNNIVLSETGGATNLLVGNASGGGISLAAGTSLTANGNTITFFAGNPVFAGPGTITCNGSTNFIINKTGATAFGTLLFTTGSSTINNLTLNLTGTAKTVVLGSPVTLNGTLTLTSGLLTTTTTNLMTLGSSATISGGSSTSYINGPMAHTWSTSTAAKTYPIGKFTTINNYRPVYVSLTNPASPVLSMEMINSNPAGTVDASLRSISIVRYFQSSLLSGTAASGGTVKLTYDTDEPVTDAATLLVGQSTTANGQYSSIGNSANDASSVTSSSYNPALGDFLVIGDAIGGSNALPVELTGFAANAADGAVNISWSTATEINNLGFDVERNSGGTWEKVGFVKGNGNSNSPKNYSFTDNSPVSGKAQYRLKQIDTDGKYKYYDAITVNVDAPKDFKLMQNSPNPFNPSTAIKFQLPVSAMVTIRVYDQIGREVATLVNQEQSAGSHIVYWNGRDNNGQMVSSGMYLYRISAGSYSETRKMNLLK